MQCIGLIRLDRENLPIYLLGSLQTASLMVPKSNRQCLGYRCHKRMLSAAKSVNNYLAHQRCHISR